MTEPLEIIREIVEIEVDMFLNVPADGEYGCRQHPDQFRLHRRAQFSIWSQDTLCSYLGDLQRAKADGTNLMTVKYARMGNLIPRGNHHPLIEAIFEIQIGWQREMFEKYPKLMGGARPLSADDDSAAATSFETYLKSELETYSERTLSLLHRDLSELQQRGINGAERLYEHLVREMGYASLEEVERRRG